MSIKTLTGYTLICDWPDCGADALDGTDYSSWSDVSYVMDQASDAGWLQTPDGSQWYCDGHLAVWASDHEDGEPFPDPPFLLIHDGDTDNPTYDDGHVKLVTS